jgi:hypothetical protein
MGGVETASATFLDTVRRRLPREAVFRISPIGTPLTPQKKSGNVTQFTRHPGSERY